MVPFQYSCDFIFDMITRRMRTCYVSSTRQRVTLILHQKKKPKFSADFSTIHRIVETSPSFWRSKCLSCCVCSWVLPSCVVLTFDDIWFFIVTWCISETKKKCRVSRATLNSVTYGRGDFEKKFSVGFSKRTIRWIDMLTSDVNSKIIYWADLY